MTQSRSARGADIENPRCSSGYDATFPREQHGRPSPTPRYLSDAVPDLTVSALDRLIARIETGTATPEDVDDLPEGVVEYLHAVLTLTEMGTLGQDWEVTPNGGFLVLNVRR